MFYLTISKNLASAIYLNKSCTVAVQKAFSSILQEEPLEEPRQLEAK